MGEQENSLRTTRASNKRPFDYVDKPSLSLQQIPLTKKRTPLGELTNSSDVGLARNSDFGDTQKSKPKLKETNKKEVEDLADTEIVATSDNAQKCAYTPLIYQHLHSLEVEEKRRPLADYMETVQKDVNPAMRDILSDWLVEVAEEYKLVSDTLYLTVSYIDRFLSQHAVSRNKLQLLGVSCMLVASKYEEINPPRVEDFCFITDNTFAKEEVGDMEQQVLKFLNFNMGTPTIKTFMRYFIKAAEGNCMVGLPLDVVNGYIMFLFFLALILIVTDSFLPSMVAASAVFLSRFTIQPSMHPWNLVLQYYSGYRPSELKECVLAIHDLQLSRRGISLRAVREKYMEHKFKRVATLSSPSEIPANYFEAVDG